MQQNKISATATRRFMAGALSVALLGGGLAVVPAVATAQDAQCVVNEPRKGNGVGELSFDKQTYKPGDVVTMTGTGFAARPSDGFLGMKLNSNKSEWPADQSAGDNLEYNEGNATTLEIPAATVGNGNFTVRVVLPAFDAKFQAGKQVITLLGGNDGGPVASRSAVIWVNETGDDSDACGATPSVKPQPDPQPQPEPSQPEKTSEAPAPSQIRSHNQSLRNRKRLQRLRHRSRARPRSRKKPPNLQKPRKNRSLHKNRKTILTKASRTF